MNKQFLANFNWKTYISLNPDLNHVTNEADAIKHYATYGIYERRSYKYKIPADFNWETYILLNPDLNHVTSKHAAVKHYSEHGVDEQRIYNIPTNNAKVKIKLPKNKITKILEATEISIVNKQTFREACLQQLPLVKNIEIPEIMQNCHNETVLIEFRWFGHLEFWY